jgi:hypothetical protein
MEQPVQPEELAASSPSEPEITIGRRQLLKALATGGFALAFTRLPQQWIAPRAEVGAIPIHAQVSGSTATPTPTPTPTPTATPTLTPTPQPTFSGVCDSLPGGGDLRITQGAINSIQPYLQLISGVASLQGIPATMTVQVTSASSPAFNPPLPQTATTDDAGRANFGNLAVTGEPGDSFFLVFNFATSNGTVQFRCGEFFFGTNELKQRP